MNLVMCSAAARVVRTFHESLARGRMVDALDLFAPDAVLLDASGGESRGIRAIAASLLPYRKPHSIALDRIESTDPDVRVIFRTAKSRHYRGVFSVEHGRIRTARLERIS